MASLAEFEHALGFVAAVNGARRHAHLRAVDMTPGRGQPSVQVIPDRIAFGIAKELPEAIEADKKLTEMKNRLLDSIKVMEQKFKDKYDAYTKGRSMMTTDAQKKEEDELRAMQNAYSVFQEENFGNQGSLVRKRNELLQPVLARIQESIQTVSKEEGLSFVFDKAASAVLVFADDKYDITFKIIDHMKRSKK